jgi:glucose/mannose transport system substrate-binding protein
MKIRHIFAIVLITVSALSGVLVSAQDAPSGDLEIFSWWAGGGEAAGLDALIAKFNEEYPDVNVVNSAVAGGSGVNAKAVLATRLEANDPPGTFQAHAGSALNDIYVPADKLQPLNDLYEANGWLDQYPQGLLDLISKDGNIYAVPVNIHRSNVMWYVPANLEEWGVTVPADWDEFLSTTCPALQEQGVVPLSVGQAWTQMHLWESVAVAILGPDGWAGLWTGDTAWDSPEILQVFETYNSILDCTNEDRDAIDWQPAAQMVVDGTAAFNIMGDWAAGLYLVDMALEPGTGFAWAASPGTEGTFIMLSDAFGLPKDAPNEPAVLAWLTLLGSAEGQDIFNPLKGSLPANTTADIGNADLYNAYFQDAYADWTSNAIVGSLAHEAVGAGEFQNGFSELLAQLASSRDPETAAAVVVELADETLGG